MASTSQRLTEAAGHVDAVGVSGDGSGFLIHSLQAATWWSVDGFHDAIQRIDTRAACRMAVARPVGRALVAGHTNGCPCGTRLAKCQCDAARPVAAAIISAALCAGKAHRSHGANTVPGDP